MRPVAVSLGMIALLVWANLSMPVSAQPDASVLEDASPEQIPRVATTSTAPGDSSALLAIPPDAAIADSATFDAGHDAPDALSPHFDGGLELEAEGTPGPDAASGEESPGVVNPSSDDVSTDGANAIPPEERSGPGDQTEAREDRPAPNSTTPTPSLDRETVESGQTLFGSPAPVERVDSNNNNSLELAALLPSLPRADQIKSVSLVFFIILAGLLSWMMRRIRNRLPSQGVIPITLSLGGATANIALAVVGLMLLSRFVPSWLNPTLRWILLAAAAAVGWSIRDLLPDLLGGFVLSLERRIKAGVWVSGRGFSGLIESKGLRAIWVRDAHGHLISIPNRHFLVEPIQTDSGIGVGHEVLLRVKSDASSSAIRQAVNDAILSSPWVPPSVRPQVLRDTADPTCWRVRCRLLEPDHALHFEGELLERIEDILSHSPRSPAAAITASTNEDDQPQS